MEDIPTPEDRPATEQAEISTPEELQTLKQNIALDDDGMIAVLGKRFILTPQDTFSDMMRAAADIGGINLAKVLMRKAGYEAAYKVSLSMIEKLGLTGEALVRHYTKTGGKRGWSFGEVEVFDGEQGLFLCKAAYSPFVIRFTERSRVPVCDFLSGAFEAMCHAAGYPRIRIIETRCIAKGDPVCVFENKKTD
jgi:predicted hydrocarbon binding protein